MLSEARNRSVAVPAPGTTATSLRRPKDPNVSAAGVPSLGSGFFTSVPGQADRTRIAATATGMVVHPPGTPRLVVRVTNTLACFVYALWSVPAIMADRHGDGCRITNVTGAA